MSKESVTPPSEEKEGGEVASPAESVELDAIAGDIMQNAPDVQPEAIEQHNLKESAKVAQFSQYKDVDGKSFDPGIHKTDKDGNPTISPKGKLIKKPGRKAGQSTDAPKQPNSVLGVSSTGGMPLADRTAARTTGKHTANLLLTVGVVVGGTEWQPIKNDQMGIDERATLETAFADYFEAKDIKDLPPGVALSIAILGYAAPRFMMPQTKARLKALGAKLKKPKKTADVQPIKKATDNGTLAHSGDDRIRENNASQATGGEIQSARV